MPALLARMTTGSIMLLLVAAAPPESARVDFVIDGDTFRLASGERIRIAEAGEPAIDEDSRRFKERLGQSVKHKPVVNRPSFLTSAFDSLRTLA